MLKRKLFAENYLGISSEDLSKIIFSDEIKFELFSSNKKNNVRYFLDERYHSAYIIPTVKFGGVSVLAWGCISSKEVSRLVFIDGIMTAAHYVRILAQQLNQFAGEMSLTDFEFMHEKDPKHTARVTTKFLEEKGIKTINWPPQSSDLNPIENVWAYIKFRLRGMGRLDKETLKHEIIKNLE